MQLKSGWLEALDLVTLFFLRNGTSGDENLKGAFVNVRFCHAKIFSKTSGQICVKWDGYEIFNFALHASPIVLLVALFVFPVDFELLDFFLIRL